MRQVRRFFFGIFVAKFTSVKRWKKRKEGFLNGGSVYGEISMSNKTLRKTSRSLAPIIFLLILTTAITAFAASKLITAKKGGTIEVAPGVELVFKPNSLAEDTVVYADALVEPRLITYEFGPDGLELLKPAKLIVSRRFIQKAGVDDLILYAENGEEIDAKIKKKCVIYELEHFSRYYHRRR